MPAAPSAVPCPRPDGRLPAAPLALCEEISARPPVPDARLAVIVNCYNYAQYVGAAIDSVTAQLRPDCEILVVDDGSTDGSWQVIRQCGVNALRIRNRGQIGACLAGLDRTSAPFVLFLDADDTLKPGALARILRHLDPGVAKLQFPLTRIGSRGEVLGPAIPALGDFRQRAVLADRVLKTGSYVTPPTSGNVFRRDLCDILREVDYDNALDGVILFAAPFFGDVVSLSAELGCYRVHGENKSGQGQRPDGLVMAKHLDRFAARTAHLRRILDRTGQGGRLAPTESMYFFAERRLCSGLALGRRPAPGQVLRLLGALRHENWPLKSKGAMAAFFLLAAVLPVERSRRLMEYRFRFGERSVRGFVHAMLQKA